MKLLFIKSRHGAELLGAKLSMDGQDMEVCGLAKEELRDGLLWQWWIVMEDKSTALSQAVPPSKRREK